MSKIITPEDGKLFQSAKKFEKEAFRVGSKAPDNSSPADMGPKRSVRPARGTRPVEAESQPAADRVTRDAERNARRMIRDAEKRAASIRARARKEGVYTNALCASDAASIRARARKEGHAEGLEEARKQAVEENARSGQLVTSLIEQLKARDADLIVSLAPQLADLAVDIAHKVVRSAVEKDSSIATSLAEDAISKILDREKLIIRVNPADADLMKAHREALLNMFDGTEKIEIVAEPAVEVGGCIVETSLIKVDAQISSQLDAARRMLRNEVES